MSNTQLPERTRRETLYEIIRRESTFEQKATDALELAAEYLGVETGVLTRIDSETGSWEALVSTDSGPVPAGIERELEETYCRHVVESGSRLVLPDVTERDWDGEPVAQADHVACYLGYPLEVDSEVDGTVCFVASDTRDAAFDDAELLFAELVTQLLERELNNKRAEEQLREQRSEAQRREQALQRSYEIVADTSRSLEQQIDALLDIVREAVDTEYATLSHVRGDEYEFEAVSAPPDADITVGDTIPLETTNCERVVETTETLVLNDIQREAPELAERTGNVEWGFSCYLGAPVRVEGDVYGTFCFYGTNARIDEFSNWQVTFVDLLSDWVSRALERRERERALNEAKTQLEAATEAAGVGTFEWHVEEDTLIMGPSFAKTFGVDPELARQGASIEEFTSAIHEDDREEVRDQIGQALDSCGEYESEYRVWDDEGTVRWVVARGEVKCDDDGTPLRFPGAVTDITERKLAEKELEQQNNRLEQFASVISHDLRNPLNVIELHLDLLRDEHESEHIDTIDTARERMETLLEDLLTLARQGDTLDDLQLVEVESVVEESWKTVETDDATIQTSCERTIRADPSRLKQVFENLFRNAIEHGDTDVTVRVGEIDGGFYVEDDGPGIPEESHDQIFDAGYTSTGDGTGFGLSIVKQVVDAHDWEIRVTDGADGGARFEITGVGTGIQ